MNGILISLLNVLIVICSFFAAGYALAQKHSIRYALLFFLGGSGIYGYEIYAVISSGECTVLSDAIKDALIAANECIGIGFGDRGFSPRRELLIFAQAAIIGGALALAILPLKRLLETSPDTNH